MKKNDGKRPAQKAFRFGKIETWEAVVWEGWRGGPITNDVQFFQILSLCSGLELEILFSLSFEYIYGKLWLQNYISLSAVFKL